MNIWLIFEKVDGALAHGVMETLYPRGDSGTAGVEQALDGYRCEVRTVRVQELDDWLKTNLLPPKARVLQRNGSIGLNWSHYRRAPLPQSQLEASQQLKQPPAPWR